MNFALPAVLVAEWHPTLNEDLRSEDVTAGSKRKVWWQRACDGVQHEWVAAVYARANGNGCAICNNRQVQVGVNDLATTHPGLAAEWHPDNETGHNTVTAGYRAKVRWLGPCGHSWEAAPQQRSRTGSGCPACAPSGGRAIAGVNDLATTHVDLAAQWHPDNTKTPASLTSWSKFKAKWVGPCGHTWTAQVSGRTQGGNGCPVCAGQQAVSGVTDLRTLDPSLFSELHPTRNGEEGIDVEALMPYSNKKAWWKGPCGHEWFAKVMRRADGIGCPVCANRLVRPGFNDLATTHPHAAAMWHSVMNGDLKPDRIAAGARRLAWWVCDDGHAWEAQVYSVSAGSGCPTCARRRSRIELAFLEAFRPHFAHISGSEKVAVSWTSPAGRTYKTAEADIFIVLPDGTALIVEYDGERYHREKPGTDLAKTKALLAAGHRVVRIRETPLFDLDLSHPRLLQTPHTNGAPLESTVAAVLAWLNSSSG